MGVSAFFHNPEPIAAVDDILRPEAGADSVVGGNGIDCRYCHTSVEQSRFAGIPPTKTCMNCHSVIWNEAPLLEPVRKSWAEKTPYM